MYKMYPPIILVTFLVITSSIKGIYALENAMLKFQMDEEGSDEGQTYEDYDGNSESNVTTPNYISDDYNTSSQASVSTETETSDTLNSENVNKASVAEAFVSSKFHENHQQTRQNRKDGDFEENFEENVAAAKDNLHTETVLDPTNNNFIYGSSNNNDTYFIENPEKETSSSEEPSFEIIEELELTTLYPAIITAPETIRPTTKTMITGTEYLSRLITDQNLRTPIAFLVDTSIDSLLKTQTQLEFSLRPRSPLDAILLYYNNSAVSEALTFKNTKTLMNVVNTLIPSYDDKGKLYYGIIKACQGIPYDSAIFLATAHDTDSKELFKEASKMLFLKRIRLYVMWFGEPLDPLKPTHHVQALSIQTGGNVICFDDNEKTLVAVEEQRGSHAYHFSIDDNVISMFFKLQGNLDKATLETPNGLAVNFFDLEDGYDNKSISTVINLNDTSSYGNFTLYTKAHNLDETYNVTVKILYKDIYNPEFIALAKNRFDNFDAFHNKLEDDFYGENVRNQKMQDASQNKSASQFYYTPTNEESGVNPRAVFQTGTKIDIGVQSQLLATRGSTIQLYYEVTNFKSQPNTYFFQVTDELSYLRTMAPTSTIIGPQQTATIIVTAIIPTNAEIGVKNKITFRSQGIETAIQPAWLTVTDGSGVQDSHLPWLYYTYTSRCEGRATSGTCTGAYWTVEVTAQDYQTGIMRISSSPKGIIYKAPFTAGTRDEVKATYTASCCQPRVTISAYDLNRNQKTVSLDVTDIWLNELGIATVVLGILLLISLIILLVLLIRCCIRRRRSSRDLPIYRGESRSRTPQT